MKELTDTAALTTFRQKFEAGRSFDLDDDMEFCPALLTQDDVSTTTRLPDADTATQQCHSMSIDISWVV